MMANEAKEGCNLLEVIQSKWCKIKNRAESTQFWIMFSFCQPVVLPVTHRAMRQWLYLSQPSSHMNKGCKDLGFLCLPHILVLVGLVLVGLANEQAPRHLFCPCCGQRSPGSAGGNSFFTIWGTGEGLGRCGRVSTTMESTDPTAVSGSGPELLNRLKISVPQFTHSYGHD